MFIGAATLRIKFLVGSAMLYRLSDVKSRRKTGKNNKKPTSTKAVNGSKYFKIRDFKIQFVDFNSKIPINFPVFARKEKNKESIGLLIIYQLLHF